MRTRHQSAQTCPTSAALLMEEVPNGTVWGAKPLSRKRHPDGAIWDPTSWVPHGTIGLLVPSGTIYEAFGTILLMRSHTSISFHMTVTLCGSFCPLSIAGYLSITQ